MKEWAEAMKARINATLAVIDAVANFEPRDAREVIEGVVDELNAFIRAEEGDDADATPVEAEPSDADGTTDDDTLPPAVELPPAKVSLRPEAPQRRVTPTEPAMQERIASKLVAEGFRYDLASKCALKAINEIGKSSGLTALVDRARKHGRPASVGRKSTPLEAKHAARRAADELLILGAVVEIEKRDSEGATADEVADATDLAIARVRELLGFMAHRGWVNRIRPPRAKHLFTTTADGRDALEAQWVERMAVGQ